MNDGSLITALRAREVLDCRGLPTVQVELELGGAVTGTADVPSGRSTGSNEARELRDGGDRFGGFGVLDAVANVNGEIAEMLLGTALPEQRALDVALIDLDGTEDKSRLGANALLGVSLAAARARALAAGLPLYRALNSNAHVIPVPLVNLINGGKHASNDLDFQEFIVIPVGADSILEALQISTEVNLALAEILLERYGKSALNTGDEGGYAPAISSPQEALGLLHEAVGNAGHDGRFRYGLDCAATHYFDRETGTYELAGETRDTDAMIELYLELIRDYDVITIEDPLDEEDFSGFARLTSESGIQIVGDDLFVTNPTRLQRGNRRRRRQRPALEGEPDRDALGGSRCSRHGAPKRLQGGRLRALRRDRGPDHRRPRGRARRRTDQDRRSGPRGAHGQVQPAHQDLRGARRDRRVSRPRPRGPGARDLSEPVSAEPRPLAPSPEAATGTARDAALRIALAGLEAVDVGRATAAAVALDGEELRVDGVPYALDAGGRVLIVGAGKASLAIAQTLESILGERIDGGAIAVRSGEEEELARVEVLECRSSPAERSQRRRRRHGCSRSRRMRASATS